MLDNMSNQTTGAFAAREGSDISANQLPYSMAPWEDGGSGSRAEISIMRGELTGVDVDFPTVLASLRLLDCGGTLERLDAQPCICA